MRFKVCKAVMPLRCWSPTSQPSLQCRCMFHTATKMIYKAGLLASSEAINAVHRKQCSSEARGSIMALQADLHHSSLKLYIDQTEGILGAAGSAYAEEPDCPSYDCSIQEESMMWTGLWSQDLDTRSASNVNNSSWDAWSGNVIIKTRYKVLQHNTEHEHMNSLSKLTLYQSKLL